MIRKVKKHLIARAYDMMKLKKIDLLGNPVHRSSILLKLCRSKNIFEKRKASGQMFLESMTSALYSFLILAVFVERFHDSKCFENEYVLGTLMTVSEFNQMN